MEERRRPTADDAMKKSKEDDDLESLRLKLIRAEKKNGELRNRIIEQQVKQSNVINQDGPEDMKIVQPSDAMFQDLRNRVLELVKRSNFINKDGPDDMKDMKAVQITDSIFQQVRSSINERVKQSNGMTRRQLSDAIIQELHDKVRKIIRQNDYLKEELRSTADSAFNITAEIMPQGGTEVTGDQIVRAETSAANPPVAIPPTREANEASELAPGGHPADNSGINLEGEEEQGAVFSPHREPLSSPPIQFHGDPSFLSEAPTPIQFHHHPPPFPSEAPALPPDFYWVEFDEDDDDESDLTGFD